MIRIVSIVFLAFGLFCCGNKPSYQQLETIYQQHLAFLQEKKPLSLSKDSLYFLLATTHQQLEVMEQLSKKGQDEKAKNLEKHFKQAAQRLNLMKDRPESYNMVGWTQEILHRQGYTLEDNLRLIGQTLERAPQYYQNGMNCLELNPELDHLQNAMTANQQAFHFLEQELIDSIKICDPMSSQEKGILLTNTQSAQLAVKNYLAFLTSVHTAKADQTLYAR